jgi:hypothetical protein
MTQLPDGRTGAYYVSVRRQDGATLLALGPFRRHRRALSLVDAARLHIARAGLDPWAEYGYGTCRLTLRSGLPVGRLNAALHVGVDASLLLDQGASDAR